MAVVRLPLAVQTQYAELVQQLLHDAAAGTTRRSGSLVQKTIKGRRYWYLQSSEGGARTQVYLGPDGEDLVDLLERLRRDLAEARTRAADRGALVSMAVAGGAYAVSPAEARVFRWLDGAGLFRLGGVVTGTHAFTIFANMLGVRWASGTVRTRDVDIAHDEHIAIALAADFGAVDLAAARRDPITGLELSPIPQFDPRTPSTSFAVLGTELYVDLLTPMRGKERTTPVKIASLNAAAQPLRFLDYLIEDTQPAAIVAADGVLVNVPSPARFALHKLLVATKRPVSQATKVRKDLAQAEQVLAVLLEDRPHDIVRAYADLTARGVGWSKPVRASLPKLPAPLRAALAEHGVS
jgi:hypothetical protein